MLVLSSSRAQDATPALAPSAPVTTIVQRDGPDRWDAVLDAIADLTLKIISGIGVLVVLAIFLGRSWLMRLFKSRDSKDMAVQTMKAEDQNIKGEALALLLREKAKESVGLVRDKLLAHAE